jgi:small conductance mechanosensitive channel
MLHSLGTTALVVAIFTAAWLVARLSARVARELLTWHDRRNESVESIADKFGAVKRRETTVAVIRATIAFSAFTVAGVFAVAQLTGGFDKLTTVAGASFVLILTAFAIQRVLTDMIAGLAMFIERWYAVGETIVIPTLDIQGVVEDVSLRRTKLRTLDGEVIHVANSQIPAVRVLPSGAKELVLELFVSEREAGARLVFELDAMLPTGPTTFVRRPWVEQIEELADRLVRIRMRATVVPGREWLVDGFLADMLKERAEPGLIVHGPVVLSVDERAAKSFARASAATRWAGRTAPSQVA